MRLGVCVAALLLPALSWAGEAPSSAPAAMPAGHPAAPSQDESDGVFRAPPDATEDDPTLPDGAIAVRLRDALDRPIPAVAITLGVIEQSIAKGENRKHLSATSAPDGTAMFGGLQSGSGVAYRVSVAREGASFAAAPFQLREHGGMRVTLHVYPVTRDIKQATVFMQGALFVDVKDDRVQIQQAFRVANFGPVAWVPDAVTVDLPEGFSAFNAPQAMSDQGFDSVPGGARLRGTFGPGEGDIGYSWQLPYGGERDVSFEVTLPPHMASLIVRGAASGQVRLEVESQVGSGWTPFAAPEPDRDEQGNRLLVTGKQVKPNDPPLKRVRVSVRDLPTPGMGRWIASSLAIFAVGIGLARYGRKSQPGDDKAAAKGERAAWLQELENLERARTTGDVGPKTYERARREMIDGLARTLLKKRA